MYANVFMCARTQRSRREIEQHSHHSRGGRGLSKCATDFPMKSARPRRRNVFVRACVRGSSVELGVSARANFHTRDTLCCNAADGCIQSHVCVREKQASSRMDDDSFTQAIIRGERVCVCVCACSPFKSPSVRAVIFVKTGTAMLRCEFSLRREIVAA